jgi:coatomer protein complex subunit gamma
MLLLLPPQVYLRRLTYLLIKELANSSDTVIIVTNCLQQDINRTDMEMFRANAMRVLCRIIDGAMLGQIGTSTPAAVPPALLCATSGSGCVLLQSA